MTRDDDLDRRIREGARALAPAGGCLDAERLAAFYAGTLAEADADAVRAHLATCPACVEASRDARSFLHAMEEPARSPRRAGPVVRLAIAAALAGIGIVGALYVARRAVGPSPSSIVRPIVVAPAPYEAGPDELVWRGAGDAPLDRAVRRYRAGDYRGAAREFAAHVEAHPGDAPARFYLGVSNLLAGDAASAASDLEAARALPGCPEDASWYLALAYLETDDLARGRRALASVAGTEGPHRDEARALLDRLGPEESP